MSKAQQLAQLFQQSPDLLGEVLGHLDVTGIVSAWDKREFLDGEEYSRFLVLEHGEAPWRDACSYIVSVSAYDTKGHSLGEGRWRYIFCPHGPHEESDLDLKGECSSMEQAMGHMDEILASRGYVLVGGPVPEVGVETESPMPQVPLLDELKQDFTATQPHRAKKLLVQMTDAANRCHRMVDTQGHTSNVVKEYLEAEGIKVSRYQDSGEPYTAYSGWTEPVSSPGEGKTLRKLYLAAVRQAHAEAKTDALLIIDRAKEVAKAGKEYLSCMMPTFSDGYKSELLPYSVKLKELLEIEGLTVRPVDMSTAQVSGWAVTA